MSERHSVHDIQNLSREQLIQVVESLSGIAMREFNRAEELTSTAEQDGLIPELRSKQAFDDLLQRNILQNTPFGLFVIDLNNFKRVNDLLGHAEGDLVLKQFGTMFNDTFKRDTDIKSHGEDSILGRFGGDEFVLLSVMGSDNRRTHDPNVQMDNIFTMLDHLEATFRQSRPDLDLLDVGLSVGGALYDPTRPVDAKTLFEQADESMYEHKSH